ncbi:MAG: hypothetical protein DHS20C21_01860 [Gemmatimonadota bacterium]|nr:MAG: hypothetical protein DHS20C21_01860 [Gemmatimonadota bacterium]
MAKRTSKPKKGRGEDSQGEVPPAPESSSASEEPEWRREQRERLRGWKPSPERLERIKELGRELLAAAKDAARLPRLEDGAWNDVMNQVARDCARPSSAAPIDGSVIEVSPRGALPDSQSPEPTRKRARRGRKPHYSDEEERTVVRALEAGTTGIRELARLTDIGEEQIRRIKNAWHQRKSRSRKRRNSE